MVVHVCISGEAWTSYQWFGATGNFMFKELEFVGESNVMVPGVMYERSLERGLSVPVEL